MTALHALRSELVKVGYEADAVVEGYVFSDVFAQTPRDRRVALAAFTQRPPSYRNAAIAAVDCDRVDVGTVIAEHRALGAPLLFVISGQSFTAYQVRSEGLPRVVARAKLDELPALFARHNRVWSPSAIHRAKSIGAIERAYQLDFVDAGLLPMVEGQVHAKLDRLISTTLAVALQSHHGRAGESIDERVLFRTTFRLLAAKVLQDRGHPVSEQWDAGDIETVLNVISDYYDLAQLPEERTSQKKLFGPAWDNLSSGINFRNISADDLAFVYENTLVTPETRRRFGTHSTPHQVAEYVVSRLGWGEDLSDVRVYEPFTGAGVFLVAALRRLRDLLPSEWTDQERHEFLVERVTGDEIDAFACEVSTLSLILADYPNANGWQISERDLFAPDVLSRRASEAHLVVCNPPFEAFSREERRTYPEITGRSVTKSVAVLNAVLKAQPSALGFVLPRAFLDERQFQRERETVERLYGDIELVALPERTFRFSMVESALLIAKAPRAGENPGSTSLRSSIVLQGGREKFLQLGKISRSRAKVRPYGATSAGELWIRELDELWRHLASHPTLASVADVHRGIEWRGDQSLATRTSAKPGYRRGLHSADSVGAFLVSSSVWLDIRPDRLLYKAVDRPWDQPKIVANAVRRSRGPWRLAAAVDESGLVCSQQLFGCWVRSGDIQELNMLAAVMNGPVANAFVTVHSPMKSIRVSTMKAIPLPVRMPREVVAAVTAYVDQVTSHLLEPARLNDRPAAALLDDIDSLVLRAYDLPPRLERELLELFRDAERPVVHPWRHWFPEGFAPAIPLHEYRSGEYKKATRDWVTDVFTALPEGEAELLEDYLE